ncbi:MAG: helix-turn-helix domain-containing protein [Paludibacter sp.]|nr:helix-turn-helix domain-containing protein [Paludibacter sp.]
MNYNDLGVDVKYLHRNTENKNLGVTVNTVGFQTIQPHTPYPVKSHPSGYYFNFQNGRTLDEYQLIYITKGSGRLLIENREYTLTAGKIFIIRPGQWHSYTPSVETGWNEYYIGFKSSIVSNWIENSFLGYDSQVYTIGLNEELAKLYNRAIELAKFELQPLDLQLSGIVYHMIGLLIFEINNHEIASKFDLQLVERAKIIMNEQVFKNIHPGELSENLNTNYTTFRKLFKNVTGFAPATYFHELKISKAKQLLLETSHSVKEISYTLNYNSVAHFGTLFKKRTGYSPSQYRTFSR